MAQLISYAQNFEDVMLWRALGGVVDGRYIDIGAQSPTVDSVSKIFHEHGWRGIHIDPMTSYADELRRERVGDLVIQAAVAAQAGTLAFFQISGTGLSTGQAEIAARHGDAGYGIVETVVPAITLDDVLAHVDGQVVHWMKIDVEGAEHDVLAGWRESAVRPWIVVVESTMPMTQIQTHATWEPLLLEKGYRFAYFDGLNRFYVGSGHEELLAAFATGPNVFDRFALSGTSSSGFAAELTSRLSSIQQAWDEDREQRTLRSEEEGREASRRLALASEEFAAGVESLQARLEEAGRQHADDRRSSEEQVASLHARLAELHASLDDARRAYAIELSGLAARLESAGLSHEEERRALHEERHEIAARLNSTIKDVEWLRGEWNITKSLLEERIESERRWQAVAQLRGHELDNVYASTSWRVTTPLRTSKEFVAAALAFPGRVGRSLAFRGKRLAGSMGMSAVRYGLARPRLSRACGTLFDRFPHAKARLRTLALGESPAIPDYHRPALAGPRIHPTFHPSDRLSRRANEVLREMYQSAQGSQS